MSPESPVETALVTCPKDEEGAPADWLGEGVRGCGVNDARQSDLARRLHLLDRCQRAFAELCGSKLRGQNRVTELRELAVQRSDIGETLSEIAALEDHGVSSTLRAEDDLFA